MSLLTSLWQRKPTPSNDETAETAETSVALGRLREMLSSDQESKADTDLPEADSDAEASGEAAPDISTAASEPPADLTDPVDLSGGCPVRC